MSAVKGWKRTDPRAAQHLPCQGGADARCTWEGTPTPRRKGQKFDSNQLKEHIKEKLYLRE